MTDENPDQIDSLLEQRRIIIDFGRTALQSDSLMNVLTEACEHCRRALGTDLSKVMRLEEDGRHLRVIAGVGWDEGVVGEEVVPAVKESSEGFALSRGKPAVSEDVRDDSFDYPDFLLRHGVRAMVNVVIPGADGQPPYGLLQVDSVEPREFAQTDIEFLQGYAVVLGAAIERFQKSEALRTAMAERERALNELQHRVKNNLAILKGLFRTRHRRADHPQVQQEIAIMLGQIETLARLHDLLSASSNIDQIEIGGFLSNLASQIASLGSRGEITCEINTSTEIALVDSGLAVPLGIVANEFITNSIKYATRDGRCAINLSIGKEAGEIVIEMSDDGRGLGDALARRQEENTGSGLNYIEALLDQIGAERDWSGDDGARLRIRIPTAGLRAAGDV